MAIQIGKYKRPGIFIEEFDKSIIATPQSVDQLTNLVLGVSKKGPVNTPVKVSTLNEFEAIFGEIDRNLERRGSFFHRTVEKMLESSPVYAMNLLLTNDNLDTAEYQTLSTSSDILNDSKRLGAYRRFHDTTGFWKKDTESFINLTRSNPGYGQRALNITNLSDKPVSVFIYKTRVNNFDVTAESWFGSKKPNYINSNDFISDYMVDVVVVDGDWSNYKTLAQDKVWSNYFFYDTKLGSGLRKNLVLDFIQNRNVKVLGYYEGLSLIPYFRDGNNKNLFIETNLNKDTDKTGIFCSYNIDIVETDGINNVIDLVGHTIAAKNETYIDFLSYQANISEEIKFEVKPLDLPGNVTANLGGMTCSGVINGTSALGNNYVNVLTTRSTYTSNNYNDYSILAVNTNVDHFYPTVNGAPTYSGVQKNYKNRTSLFADGTTWGIRYISYNFDNNANTNFVYTSATNFTIKYNVHDLAYAIIDGEYKPVVSDAKSVNNYKEITFTVTAADYPQSTATQSYVATVYYDYETSGIKLSSSLTSGNVIGITSKDIVLNTFKFKLKGDSNGVNKFVPFNSWNIYKDVNGNRVDRKFSPVYTSDVYGWNAWPVVNPATNVFNTTFQGHWMNSGSSSDSILNTEGVHVDVSFLNPNSDYSNPLIHDNSSYIQTFYKNKPTKAYLFDDTAAVIGASGNQKFTGGSFSTANTIERSGFVYDNRILSYSNVDKWNYGSFSPVFATSSPNSIGSCTFTFDDQTEQFCAELSTGTKWASGVSQLSSGDLVSVWYLDPSLLSTKRALSDSNAVPTTLDTFNSTGRPTLFIVDRVDLSSNRVYFLNNQWANSNGPYPILNAIIKGTALKYQMTPAKDINGNSVAVNANVTNKSGFTGLVNGPADVVKTNIAVRATFGGASRTYGVATITIKANATAATISTGVEVNFTSIWVAGLTVNELITTGITFTVDATGTYGLNLVTGQGGITTAPTTPLTFKFNQTALNSMQKDLSISTEKFTLEKVNHDLFDYRVSYEGDGKIKYTFLNTDNNGTDPNNYRHFRRHKMFNKLVALLDSADKDKRALILNSDSGNRKVSMEGMFLSNIVRTSTQNKSFILNTNLPNSEIVKNDWIKVLQGFLTIYSVDDEVILGTNGMDTRMIGLTNSVTSSDITIGDGIGVVSKYSDLYQQYYNGYINNGDYFQNNRIPSDVWMSTDGYSVTFFDGEEDKAITGLNTGKTTLFAGYNYIMFTASFANNSVVNGVTLKNDPKIPIGDMITIKQSILNRKRITILSENMASSSAGSITQFTDANGLVLDSGLLNNASKLYIYKIAEEVVYEKVTRVKDLLDHSLSSGFNYLNMFIDNKTEANGNVVNNSLSIRFKNSYSSLIPMPPLGSVYGASDLVPLNKFYVISQSSNYKQTLEIELLPTGVKDNQLVDEDGTWIRDNQVLVKGDRYSELRIGDFLLGTNNRLVRIIDKKVYKNDSSLVIVTCNGAIKRNLFGLDWQTYLYRSVDNYTYAYKALTFKGFKTRVASLPDGTETTQNNILDIVAKGTPLFRALTNKEAIDYRYLVDSFGLGLSERSKQQLADICGSRRDIFGFLNMPSVKSFKQSSSPTFVDSNGDLSVEFMAKGSNPDKAASFTYTFADGEGSTCVGYFTPYIQVDDNGRQLSMPPASHVATTYMRKHTSNLGGITPWTIAAGVTNGRITNIIGLEHNYSNEDIEWLNQSQMNPIVFKRNRGNVIETENTAQTLYKSALSYIHVREVLIELERELSRMLLDFQWQYNTAEIRAEIKLRADVICETYVNRNGLYNYFNKMDDENNTSEIIDNQIGVLDTYVEPIKGMGIIVNNVTILRTGAIDAGGFL
jgi:hypothetical protein